MNRVHIGSQRQRDVPWVKLDDSFFCHPKIVSVGAEASGLYVWALTYAAHNLTDGHVPGAWVKQAVGSRTKRLAALLVEHGLWTENGTGWLIHDYGEYQPSKAEVEQTREKVSAVRSEAGKRGAKARWAT